MNHSPLEEKLIEIIKPVVEDVGFSLHHIKLSGASGAKILQVMAEDKATKNLGVDDAAKISRALSAVLDVEDPIDGAYRLEVSSPGIDRLLIRENDYQDYIGFEAKIESTVPALENGQKKFRGRLQGLKGDKILLSTDQGDVEIPFHSVHKAKLVLTDELIKTTAKTVGR
ncbi:MAG: ribosome maturation factor RimP [Alphaproteobacteria bacterium]